MTPTQPTAADHQRTDPHPGSRQRAADAFDHFQRNPLDSQRQYAKNHDIPRSTLGDWLRQQDPPGADDELARFFRSASGCRFLNRFYLNLYLVFHLHGNCGIRVLADFLQRTGLEAFVAASYGALHDYGVALENQLARFASEERARLAEGMGPRDIAVLADEHFHGNDPCLVAIEPVSDFILVEEYQPRRDAPTWAKAIERGIEGLPAEVVLLTGDEATGLIACAKSLDAQYMPELFHGLRDLARPFLAALQRQISSAGKQLGSCSGQVEERQQAQEESQRQPARPGRPIDHARRIELAQAMEAGAADELSACEQRRDEVAEAVRGIGDDYHPFDGQTGAAVSDVEMGQRLSDRVEVLARAAAEAELGEPATEAVGRGRAWLLVLVANLAWFWSLARRRIGELQLSPEVEAVLYEKLLGGLYWREMARRGRTPADRQRVEELSRKLLDAAWSTAGMPALGSVEGQELERVCRELVGLFQRSSSSVEGRNGRLSLFQHGHTRLGERKLRALTAMHNYWSRRSDGTTAAERFFGKAQRDVVGWLLERMPEPPRPGAKRPPRDATRP